MAMIDGPAGRNEKERKGERRYTARWFGTSHG